MTQISVSERIRKMAECCVVCGLPLHNQDSVEFGIGPICRERLGFGGMSSEHRGEVGRLIQAGLAARFAASGSVALNELADKVESLGYPHVASKMRTTFADVVIEADKFGLSLSVPRVWGFGDAAKLHCRAFWRKDGKAWRLKVPLPYDPKEAAPRKAKLFGLLKEYFKGLIAVGPKGFFML